MGTPDDYLDLHARLLTTSLGQSLVDDFRQDHAPFYVGEEVTMGRNVELLDWVSIGSRATIGDGARLERVVVWDELTWIRVR